MTLMILFISQIVFCFGICYYTNSKVRAAELRNEKQKAEFYSFIYQFHKQMTDEEAARVNLYNKSNSMMATPGAPSKME